MSIINWAMDHWLEITEVVTGIILVAEIIVKLTPTEKDDSALERFGQLWSKVTKLFPSNIKSKMQ